MADEELRSSDSELGQQVQELAEIQAQLKTAGPSLVGLGQFATKIKDAWSGLITRGKAITVGVIALFVLGGVMTEPENSVNSEGTGGSNESDETPTQLSVDAQATSYKNGEDEGRKHGYKVVGEFIRIHRRMWAKNFKFIFLDHITSERSAITTYGLEHPESVKYMQFNVGLKVGYVNVIMDSELSLDEKTEYLNLMPDY